MSAQYRVGDFYVDTSTPATPVLWRCTTAGDKTSSVWAKVSGGGGAALYAITSINTLDYVTAVPIIITFPSGILTLAFGIAVNIAKHNRLRPSVGSELIDGVTITYSSYTSDNSRTASDGSNTETQVAFPRYTTMTALGFNSYLSSPPTGSLAAVFLNSLCVIKAIICTTGLTAGGVAVALEEITPRVWARKYIQP